MGLFTNLFSSRDDNESTRVREHNQDQSKVTGDKIIDRSDDSGHKHEHRSYTLDRTSGSYKEYSGGENSSDRSYNKSSSSDSSSDSDSRVICTHLFRSGLLERDIWRADMEFTRCHLGEATIRGYHYWAIPYVRLMRRSKLAERIMAPIARARATELAFRMGGVARGSPLGKLVRLIGEPLCFCIGLLVSQRDYKPLWSNERTTH